MSSETHFGIRPGGIEATEQFVQARYYMHAQVYSHSVRLCTDNMFVRALLLAITEDDLEPLTSAFTYADTPEFALEFSSWDDQRILAYAESLHPESSKFASLIKRLTERRLFKRLFYQEADDMDRKVREALTSAMTVATKRRIESEIARELHIHPNDIIFSSHSINWGFKRVGSLDEGDLLVIDDDGSPAEFRSKSLIFKSISRLPRMTVSVYGPTDNLRDWSHSAESRSCTSQQIAAIVKSVISAGHQTQEDDPCR